MKNQLIDNQTEKVLKNTEATIIFGSNAGSTSGLSNQVEVNSHKTNQETRKKTPVHYVLRRLGLTETPEYTSKRS